ncbi:hypothetical protein FAES_5099 [Fibrella aestuarina BUZ 2]|uniref:Uncharacterized protein n=1 Tax=Fibrella aestuarina BUZ 2 TaxID=1166018 RepID=I0KG45_9BACT|nr:carboxypeptidase-like regulatory domain-containing protein [Fibrella aestuarina]CCH03098.1 hypothetical protein FAES_5099 [Fibrella aestuarina BUZ 2]
MKKIVFSLLLLFFWHTISALDNNYAGIIGVAQKQVDGTPGETFSNIITLTNPTDQSSDLRLTLTAPKAFRLLTQLPTKLTLGAHSTRQVVLKFMIERTWTGEAGTVRIESAQANVAEPSVSQFMVQPNRNAPSVLSFTLLDDAPLLAPGQDTLFVPVRFSNQSPHARVVRIRLYSLPDGFRLPRPFLEAKLTNNRDSTLYIPCLTTGALTRDRRYDLTIEVQDGDKPDRSGPFLGSIICRPVLLASAKRFTDRDLLGESPFGVAVGVGKLGRAGLVNELRTWGQQTVGKGRLDFKLYYLNYAQLNYHELRDTYVHYQQNDFELHVGNLYDMHELSLIGVGVRAAGTFSNGTRVEGWALRNQSNWLAGLVPFTGNSVAQFQATQPLADQTYSMRVSGTLPLPGEARYELSSSFYQQRRLERAGLLHYAAAQWRLNAQSTLKLRVGNSYEYSPAQAGRQQLTGWAAGGSFNHLTKSLDLYTSAYISSPVYGGIQRGATLLEHSLTWKKWRSTRLAYRYSQIKYNQLVLSTPSELTSRQYGNTVADLYWAQQIGRLTTVLRPYVWIQDQALPSGVNQRANSYRLMASLRYETRLGARLEAGIDAGRFDLVTPPTNAFRVPSMRYVGSVGYGNLTLTALYQQGPFLINDYQTGQGNPAGFRQLSVGPTAHVNLLDGRLRANLGAGLTYNSTSQSWNGLLYNSIHFQANPTLRFNLDINTLSYGQLLSELSAMPGQDTQLRLEVAKTFRRLPGQSSRTMRLRFFEDENNNQRKDGNEQYLPDLVVNVNETSMLTDRKGQVVCKDIPRGTYTIRAVSKLSTGEPVWFQDTVQVVNSVELELGIRKTWRTAGQLRCQRARYDNQPCDLEQYRVETTGAAGELYRTYADADGRFTLYLPVGTYQLSVIPVQTPANRKQITYNVETGGQQKQLDIDLAPNSRPVQYKRFTKN